MKSQSLSTTDKSLRSQSLDLLRFPLALVIVAIHLLDSNGFSYRDISIHFDDYSSLHAIKYIKAAFMKNQSVPVYFFISGYVFFLGGMMNRERFKKKFENRYKSLVIPYLSWNILALLLMLVAFVPFFGSLTSCLSSQELDFSLKAIFYTFWDAGKGVIKGVNNTVPQDFSMWFVRDLIVIVATTPILYLFIRKFKYKFLISAGVFWIVGWYYDAYMLCQFLTGFFFFIWGATYSILGLDMIAILKKYRKPSLVLYPVLSVVIVLSLIYFPECYKTLKMVNIIAGLFFAFNLSILLLEKRWCKINAFLAASSFFIYAAHPLILSTVQKIVFVTLTPKGELGILTGYVMTFLIVIELLLLCFYFTNLSKVISSLFIGRRYNMK